MRKQYDMLFRKIRQFSTKASSSEGVQGNHLKTGYARRLWDVYMKSLERYPFQTKCTSAALIFFTSDLGTQYITSRRDSAAREEALELERVLEFIDDDESEATTFSFDFSRALSGSAFGIFGTAWLHHWWGFLEKAVELRVPRGRYRMQNTLLKVFVDQSMSAPLYIYCYFFITSIFKKYAPNEEPLSISSRAFAAHENSTDLLPSTLSKHWRLWPFVHFINFYFVPLQHRVLIQNMVLVGWSGYLSYLNNNNVFRTRSGLIRRETKNIGLDILEESKTVSKLK